jgi:hypothetical protein
MTATLLHAENDRWSQIAPAHLARSDVSADPALSPEDAVLLERLRLWARAAQLAPPLDLDRACALISAPHPSEDDFDRDGRQFLSALSVAADRRITLRPSGTLRPSEDEAMLLRLLERLQAGDGASARFLVARRVVRRHRRAVLFLAARLASTTRSPGGATADPAERKGATEQHGLRTRRE